MKQSSCGQLRTRPRRDPIRHDPDDPYGAPKPVAVELWEANHLKEAVESLRGDQIRFRMLRHDYRRQWAATNKQPSQS